MGKQTRAVIRTLQAGTRDGFIVLDVFPDILRPEIGADFYIGQKKFVVEKITDNSETVRTIELRRPTDQETST